MFFISFNQLKGILGRFKRLKHYHAPAFLSELHLRFPDLQLRGRSVLAAALLGIVILSGVLGHFSGQNSHRQNLAAKRLDAEMDVLVLANYRNELASDDALQGVQQPIRRAGTVSGMDPEIPVTAEQQGLLWLARELASAQADIARLCALGRKLVTLAEMDDGEFEFACDPVSPAKKKLTVPAELESADTLEGMESSSLLDNGSIKAPVIPDFDAIREEVALLFPGIDHIQRQLEPVEAIFTKRRTHSRAWPSGSPLFGATQRSVSSGYGYRIRQGKNRFHKGLDLAASPGSAVLAMASGVVSFAGTNGDYGNLIEIEHGNGYTTRYGHNRQNLVEVGSMVRKGQMIARVGSTGKSTGPHLHVEIRKDGSALDPLRFISLP